MSTNSPSVKYKATKQACKLDFNTVQLARNTSIQAEVFLEEILAT
jgi:hypothetical protein